MDKLRLRFAKTGRAVYISHLDLMRTMTRAFLRAGCRLKYSEGFNPHPKISIALPLSVGTQSICELMDFELIDNDLPDDMVHALNHQLPEGLMALEIYEPERKVKDLKWLWIEGSFEYDDRRAEDVLPGLEKFFAQESIVISRKTKRGVSDSDIKPAIKELKFTVNGDSISLSGIISAQEPTLNPELLADALRQKCPNIAPDFAKFKRIDTFDENMGIFR